MRGQRDPVVPGDGHLGAAEPGVVELKEMVHHQLGVKGVVTGHDVIGL